MFKHISSLLFLHLLYTSLYAETYYVSLSGNDTNSGTSENEAWRSVAKLNNFIFDPGDTILFEGGSIFDGGIYFYSETGEKGKISRVVGTAEKPIVFSSFGTGRAIISSDTVAGFKVYNGAGFVVKNLIFKGAGWELNSSFGVEFYMDMPDTLLEYVIVDSVEVHGYHEAGVSFQSWDQTTGGFKYVNITNSTIYDNGDAGISFRGQGNYCHKNVYVGYNKVYHNRGLPDKHWNHSGSGIIIGSVNGGLIEYCEAYENGGLGKGGGPYGIWGYNSNNLIIQKNISHHNRTGVPWDGGGFDLEGSTNSIMQYNYSYMNDGAGFLVGQYYGAPPTKNIIVRNNISENDGRKNKHAGVHIWARPSNGGIQNAAIYNNTVFISPTNDGTPSGILIHTFYIYNTIISNNIFFVTGDLEVVHANRPNDPNDVLFSGNVYRTYVDDFKIGWDNKMFSSLESWREATGQEMHNGQPTGFSVDPHLVNPGAGITIGDPKKLYTLTGYQLQEDSPLIGVALDLQKEFGIDPGEYDFFGNSLEGREDFAIGAHQPTDNSRLCLNGGLIPLDFGPEEDGAYAGEGVVEENYFDPRAVGEGNHAVKYIYTDETGEEQLAHYTFQVVEADTTAWTGKGGDWFKSDNWSTCVPTGNIDASILAPAEGTPEPVIPSKKHAQVRDLHTAIPLAIEEEGNLEITGKYQGPDFDAIPESTIIFNNQTMQEIPAGTYGRLHLQGAGEKQLAGPVSILQELELEGNKLFLGDYPLTVRSSAGVTASPESYVVTNGAGVFTHLGVQGEREVLFPVGIASSYLPATLRNAGEPDDFSVRVREGTAMNSGSLQVPEVMLNKIWFVEEKTAGGSDVQLSLQWNESDEPEHFLRTKSFISQHREGEWVNFGNSRAAYEGTWEGTYTNSLEDLEALGAFGIGSESTLTSLPGEADGPGLLAYPNPFSGELNLEVAAEKAAALEITLVNVQGRQVLLKILPLIPGTNQFRLVLPEGLPAGLYLLSTSLEGKKNQLKLMKE